MASTKKIKMEGSVGVRLAAVLLGGNFLSRPAWVQAGATTV
jgi:hypothetical protein